MGPILLLVVCQYSGASVPHTIELKKLNKQTVLAVYDMQFCTWTPPTAGTFHFHILCDGWNKTISSSKRNLFYYFIVFYCAPRAKNPKVRRKNKRDGIWRVPFSEERRTQTWKRARRPLSQR